MALSSWLRRITFQAPPSPLVLQAKTSPQSAPQEYLDSRGLLAWDAPKGAEKSRRALSAEIEAMRRRLNLPASASLSTLIRAVQGLDPLPGAASYDSHKARGVRGRVHEAEERLFGITSSSAMRYTPLHTFEMLLKASTDYIQELQEQPPVERHALRSWSVPTQQTDSYALSILFGGASWEAAYNLMEEYTERLPQEGRSKKAALGLLQDLALIYLPGRRIHEVTDEEFELTWLSLHSNQDLKNLAHRSLLTGRPLEFGYRSSRPRAWRLKGEPMHPAGSNKREHIRRVNVLSVAEDGSSFTGSHARGIRTFKFSEVTEANIPALQPAAVGPEPFAKVGYSKTDGKLHFLFGYLTNAGGIGADDSATFAWYFAKQQATEG